MLTEKEYREFGKEIIRAVQSRKSKYLSDKIYLNETYERLKSEIDSLGYSDLVSNPKWKSYRVEMNDQFKYYLRVISTMTKGSDGVEVSRFYKKNNRPHLIFTIYSEGGGQEIVDFELVTIGENTYLTDYHSFKTGIHFSESFIWDALNKLEYGVYGGEYIDALAKLKSANTYLERNQPERAWKAISVVPEYFHNYPNFQIVELAAAQRISDSLYVETLADFISNNWDETGFRYLRSFEYYVFTGDSLEARNSLDSLKVLAGESAFIDELRQWLY